MMVISSTHVLLHRRLLVTLEQFERKEARRKLFRWIAGEIVFLGMVALIAVTMFYMIGAMRLMAGVIG